MKLDFTLKLRRKSAATDRKERAVRSAVRHAGVALGIGALIQIVHMLVPAVPISILAAVVIVAAWRARDAAEAWQYRRSGGRRNEKLRRRHQGTATRHEIHRKLSPRAARRLAYVIRPDLAGVPRRRIPTREVAATVGYALTGKEARKS